MTSPHPVRRRPGGVLLRRLPHVLAGVLAAIFAVATPAAAGIPFDLGRYDADAITYRGGSVPFEEAGAAVAGGCEVTGDDVPDTIVGAPSATVGGAVRAGRVYVVPGRPRTPGAYDLPVGGAGVPSDAIAIDGVAADHELGSAVACAGDVNGDHEPDLLLGARGTGGAFVVFGGTRLGGLQRLELSALGDGGFAIDFSGILAATTVAGVGDLDGDGLDDVAIGDEYGFSMTLGDVTGAVWVVPGKDTDTDPVDLTDGTEALLYAEGVAAGDALGAIAPAGDVDGDDKGDFVIGARRHDGPNGADSGAAYVIDGDARGKVELGGASAAPGVLKRIWGPAAGAQAGGAVASAGTVAGSVGIAVGMGQGAVLTTPTQHRRVWVVRGASQTVNLATPGANAYAITGLTTVNGSDEFGRALAAAGDLDGDGLPDLAIGALGVTGAGNADFAGAAFLVYGQAGTADRAVSSLTCEQGAQLFATQIQTRLGASLTIVPGSTPQLLLGAPGNINGNFARVLPLADVPGACGDDREPEPTADLDLDFGFRENLRGYVFRGFDASNPAVPIAATDGASCDANSGEEGGCDPRGKTPTDPYGRRALRWTPVGAGATDGSDTTIATIGMVTFHFPAHFFVLRVRDPWVVISGGTATVRARVTLDVTDGFGGARPADVRVNLGTYPLTGAPVRAAQFVQWRTEPGTLTDEAWAALGGSFLGRGAELDPITLAIPRSLGALPQEPTAPATRDPDPIDPPRRDPPREDPPRVAVATFTAGVRSATVRRATTLKLGTVACRVQRCRVTATRAIRVRIGRDKRGRARFVVLKVSAPATLARGRRGQLRLTVSRAAAKALAGRSVRVKVKIGVSGDGRPLAKTVTVTLRGARPSSTARRR